MIALAASAVGLAAAAVLLRRPEAFAPPGQVGLLVASAAGAVAGAWVLMHTTFTLHYAHLYYRAGGAPEGLAFVGGPPDDRDFAYFAFTLGMCYQTSDVAVTTRTVRRVVLGQAVLAFVYNTVILALAVNLLFGRLQ